MIFVAIAWKPTQRILARKLNRGGNRAMKDIRKRHRYTKLCKTLAIFLLACLFGAGCGLDKGSSGDIPPENVFLVAQGCLVDNPGQRQAGTIVYSDSFPAPFGLSLMEARLKVLRGEADVVVTADDATVRASLHAIGID